MLLILLVCVILNFKLNATEIYQILFHTAGITLLTLVVNGTTTKGLLQTLKLTEVTVGQKDEMNNAVRRMRKCKYNMIKSFEMATRQWMVDSRWDLVEKIVKIENPYDPVEQERALTK